MSIPVVISVAAERFLLIFVCKWTTFHIENCLKLCKFNVAQNNMLPESRS